MPRAWGAHEQRAKFSSKHRSTVRNLSLHRKLATGFTVHFGSQSEQRKILPKFQSPPAEVSTVAWNTQVRFFNIHQFYKKIKCLDYDNWASWPSYLSSAIHVHSDAKGDLSQSPITDTGCSALLRRWCREICIWCHSHSYYGAVLSSSRANPSRIAQRGKLTRKGKVHQNVSDNPIDFASITLNIQHYPYMNAIAFVHWYDNKTGQSR